MNDSKTDDELTLLFAGIGSIGAIIGAIGYFWQQLLGWLTKHQVLVPGSRDPVVVIPYGTGAGLDVGRLAIGAAVVLALVAVAASWTVRQWRAGREIS